LFKSNVIRVRSCGDRLWELEEPVVYEGKDEVFTIPEGFKTDFASVPAAVQWLIPSYGRYTLAAVVHDYFCTALNHAWLTTGNHSDTGTPNGRDTDAIFRRIMRELGVPPLRRRLIWTGVRWGAAVNPARCENWFKDLPMVLFFSILAAPVVVPATILAGVGLFIDKIAENTVKLFGGK